MVTVGYGDFSPKTDLEMILCIFTMLFTCGMFAYALNSINSVIANYNQYWNEIKIKIEIINRYMTNKKISKHL